MIKLSVVVGLIEEAITERTKAIIPVKLFGQTANMEPFLDMQKNTNFL
ncbi:MAG: DegT/DnrJ/EryC1/StrS family aminotransferase [Candidatus Hodarchaeota archaeon]